MSYHTLPVGNSFYLRESSQQVQQCKGLCTASAFHPVSSKEKLPSTAAPSSPLAPTTMLRSLHDTTVLRISEKDSMQSQRQVRFLTWGTCRLEKITSYFYLLSAFSKHICLTLLVLPSYSSFSCQASRSAFFSCAYSFLCGHFHLPPSLPGPNPLKQMEEGRGVA